MRLCIINMHTTIWQRTGNLNWLSTVCYDLAETYATLNQVVTARPFFEQGRTISQQLGHEHAVANYAQLLQQFPDLQTQLSLRQQTAMQSIRENGKITRRQYVQVTGVSQTQAYRDIEEMLEMGLIERVGGGRGTKYVLANVGA